MKEKMFGAFDLVFLFGRGITPFQGDKKAALRSLWIIILLLPVALAENLFYPPKGMEHLGTGQITVHVLTQITLSFIFSTALAAGLAMVLKKQDKFWVYFEATNWATLVFTIITLPVAIAAPLLPDMRESFDRIFVIIGCYSYLVTACIAYRSFKLNWQLAGAFAIATLFIGQELLRLLYAIQGIPDAW